MENTTENGGGTGAGEEMVIVYSIPQLELKYPKAVLSILVKTETGGLYGGGLDYAKGDNELNNYTKKEGLDGNIKKIVVGNEHCAALTHDGRVMEWDHRSYSKSNSADFIRLRKHPVVENCPSCGGRYIPKYGLAYCDRCGKYLQGKEGDKCKRAVVNHTQRTYFCSKCSKPHTTKTIKIWDQVVTKNRKFKVAYCEYCGRFLYNNKFYYSLENMNYRTINRKHDGRIKDVAISEEEIYLLSENNNLYCRSILAENDVKINVRTNTKASSGEMVALYGGPEQLLAKYKDGSLKYLASITGNDTYVVPKTIKLPAAVDKVCCGIYSTAALLNDGSVWFIAPDCTSHRLVHKSGLNVFTDIAVIARSDVYLVQAATGTTGDGAVMNITLSSTLYNIMSYRVVVELYESALNAVLKKMVLPTPRTEDSSNISATTPPLFNMPPPTVSNIPARTPPTPLPPPKASNILARTQPTPLPPPKASNILARTQPTSLPPPKASNILARTQPTPLPPPKASNILARTQPTPLPPPTASNIPARTQPTPLPPPTASNIPARTQPTPLPPPTASNIPARSQPTPLQPPTASNIPPRTRLIQNLPPPTPNMAQLYGNSHLADMTIKLADEELPAHSSILFATSSHFRKTYNADNPPPKVLDVSHYNPQAYKYLLQYYYQTQPDDLDAEGFTHLRHIAAIYGETSIVDAATAEISSQLCEDNAVLIFNLSKRFNFQDLRIESERILWTSQRFIKQFVEIQLKNLATSKDKMDTE